MYEFVCPAAVQRGGTIVVPVWVITSLISGLAGNIYGSRPKGRSYDFREIRRSGPKAAKHRSRLTAARRPPSGGSNLQSVTQVGSILQPCRLRLRFVA